MCSDWTGFAVSSFCFTSSAVVTRNVARGCALRCAIVTFNAGTLKGYTKRGIVILLMQIYRGPIKPTSKHTYAFLYFTNKARRILSQDSYSTSMIAFRSSDRSSSINSFAMLDLSEQTFELS